jgi:hypothetical protein
MSKCLSLVVLLFFATLVVKGQEPIELKRDSTTAKVDTLKPVYINPGKIAGRRAAIRSAMLPGMGQIGNGVTFYRVAKVAAIYTGATLLTLSYMENNRLYHKYLEELQIRVNNGGENPDGGELSDIPSASLVRAKDTYGRNRWVIIFSFGALYAVNIIEAYVDARLKYFDVGDDLSLKISPSLNMNTGTMYGYAAAAPGLKLTLRF